MNQFSDPESKNDIGNWVFEDFASTMYSMKGS